MKCSNVIHSTLTFLENMMFKKDEIASIKSITNVKSCIAYIVHFLLRFIEYAIYAHQYQI